MAYRYYTAIDMEEHLLSAREIADILAKEWGVVCEKSGKPHYHAVAAILNQDYPEYCDVVNMPDVYRNGIFFLTMRGLMRVYPNAFHVITELSALSDGHETFDVKMNSGKVYHFRNINYKKQKGDAVA